MSQKKKKFIQIVPDFSTSHNLRKTEDYMASVSNAMDEAGYESIYAMVFEKLSEEKFQKLKKNLNKDVKIIFINSWFEYLKFLYRNKNTKIFANDRAMRSLIVPFFCKDSYFMSHQSNLPMGIKKPLFLFFVKFFKKIKVSNPYEKKALVDHKISIEKIEYIPLAVDYDFFSKTPKKDRIIYLKKKLKIKGKVILFFATIRKFKEPYAVLKAIKLLEKEKITLLFIGQDKLDQEGGPTISEYSKKIDIQHKIIHIGNVDQSELINYFALADVGVNSSHHEGQCLAVYEMASAKIPLCLSNIGSFTSVFTDSALFHDSKDHKKLAENILRYLYDEELIERNTGINVGIVKNSCNYKKIKLRLKKFFKS